MSLEAQAKSLGIPFTLEVNDDLRYSDCDAHMASLVAINGTKAVYQGECMQGHRYEMEREIEELQQSIQIVGGKYVLGTGKGFKAKDLEEL